MVPLGHDGLATLRAPGQKHNQTIKSGNSKENQKAINYPYEGPTTIKPALSKSRFSYKSVMLCKGMTKIATDSDGDGYAYDEDGSTDVRN